MVFQSHALYPHLTVRENIGFGLSLAGRPKEEIAASGTWQGRVRHVERLGADAIIHIESEAVGGLTARTAGDIGIEPGTVVWASPVHGREVRFGESPSPE